MENNVLELIIMISKRKDENMKKELLEVIDETVENICKWANKEFKPKEITRRDALLHYIDGNDEKEYIKKIFKL